MSETTTAAEAQIQNAANAAAPSQQQAQTTPQEPTGVLGTDGNTTEPKEPTGVLGTDGNTAESQGDGGAQNTPPEPQEIEIKVPEGANEELVTAFKGVAKELALDSAKAQKIVDVFLQAEQKMVEAQHNEWLETQRKWLAEVQADPEFGGAKFEHNKNLANRALEKYGGEELIEFLKNAGLTSFPPLVRTFMRIGKAMEPDSISGKVGGAPQGEDNVDPFVKWLRETDPKPSKEVE